MEKQYVLSQKDYVYLQTELQKAITSKDLTSKQFCLRFIAIHLGMDIVEGMEQAEE